MSRSLISEVLKSSIVLRKEAETAIPEHWPEDWHDDPSAEIAQLASIMCQLRRARPKQVFNFTPNKGFSGPHSGMQKRVSFARALIDNPQRGDEAMPLLLYDEPTAGLDPVACTRIEDLIVKTTTVAKGCSVVVSHVRSTIERSAERVVMVYGGHFQWSGSVEEFRTTDNPYVEQFRTGSLRGPMQPSH